MTRVTQTINPLVENWTLVDVSNRVDVADYVCVVVRVRNPAGAVFSFTVDWAHVESSRLDDQIQKMVSEMAKRSKTRDVSS